MLMDRVKKSAEKFKTKTFAWPVLIVGLILGAILIYFGTVKVCDLNDQLGTKDLDEINTSIISLAKDYQEALAAENEEYANNGLTDNPNSVWKILELAPTIWIGTVIATASVFAFVFMVRKK